MESKNVLLDVVKVRTVSNHILILEFENGEARQFDMLPYLDKKPFHRLKDSPLFGKASIAHGTVVWPGNIDIAPDTLYNRSTQVLAEYAS
jgi:hypothetical protein